MGQGKYQKGNYEDFLTKLDQKSYGTYPKFHSGPWEEQST